MKRIKFIIVYLLVLLAINQGIPIRFRTINHIDRHVIWQAF